MASGETGPTLGGPSLRALSARDLVMQLTRKASLLARKEVALARSEVKEDLRTEIRTATGLGVAGVCALCTLNLLLVAVVLGLMQAEVMPGWAAALVVAAVVLLIGTAAGLVGWSRRVRQPLDTTRRSVQENLRWAKERVS
jgi:hypothetical protein